MNSQLATRYITLFILLVLSSILNLYSQPIINEACGGLQAGERIGPQIFVPREANTNRPYGSGIVTITPDATFTDPAQLNAIDYVQNLMDELLATSSNVVPIKINVKFGQPFPSGSIASNAVGQTFSKDFTSNDPLFYPLTMYSDALANKLAGFDVSPSPASPEGNITILNLGNWYYGKDAHPASNQLDFVTMLLH